MKFKHLMFWCVILVFLTSVSYAITWEDAYAKLTVTPTIAYPHVGGYYQEAELCSKVNSIQSLSLAFLFDRRLTSGNIRTAEGVDVTNYMQGAIINPQDYGFNSTKGYSYRYEGLQFQPYECKTYDWNYNTFGSGKWDLAAWTGSLISPTKTWLLDPLFNATYYRNNFLTTEDIADWTTLFNTTASDGNLTLKTNTYTTGYGEVEATVFVPELDDITFSDGGSHFGTDEGDTHTRKPAQNFTLVVPTLILNVSWYCIGFPATPEGDMYLTIETDNTGAPSRTLVHPNANMTFTSADITCSAVDDSGWNNLSFTPFELAAGTYWLRFDHNMAASGGSSREFYLALSTNRYEPGTALTSYDDAAFGSLLDPLDDLSFMVWGANSTDINIENATYGEAISSNISLFYNFDAVNMTFIADSQLQAINISLSNNGGADWNILDCNNISTAWNCNGTRFAVYDNSLKVNITLDSYDGGATRPTVYNLSIELLDYISGLTELLNYTPSIAENSTEEYSLNLTSTLENIINITGNFTLNGTSYPITSWYNTSTTYVFEIIDFSVPWFGLVSASTEINGSWRYTVETLTSNLTFFVNFTQEIVKGIMLGSCNETLPFSVLNVTYYDDVSDALITTTAAYDLTFFDGLNYTYVIGSFEGYNNNSFCTNLPPDMATYNWSVWGGVTLSKTDYVTRVFTYPEANAFYVSNNPPYDIDYYLVSLGNSSTVTFTWYDTGYNLIDGIMRIYRCDINGTKTMVETTTISSGLAVANLVLVTQPYSYDVVIDGVTYADDEYNDCHIEPTTTRTYYVTLIENIISPVIGLFLIDCTLTRAGDVVTMTWAANRESDESIQGCIIGLRDTLYGQTETYRSCTNSSSYTLAVTVPDNNNVYHVKGEITQGSVVGMCQNAIVFAVERAKQMGNEGIYAAILIIIALALMFSGNPIASVMAATVGLLLAYILGVLAIPWIVASAAIIFMIMIVFIGRYSRKR